MRNVFSLRAVSCIYFLLTFTDILNYSPHMSENDSPKTPRVRLAIDAPLKIKLRKGSKPVVIECYQYIREQAEPLVFELEFSSSAYAGLAKSIKEQLDSGLITLTELPEPNVH